MKVYTYSEARQKLANVLDEAKKSGGVQIRRQDGQTFVLCPERRKKSPLDVKGINLGLTREQIVDMVRERWVQPTSLDSPCPQSLYPDSISKGGKMELLDLTEFCPIEHSSSDPRQYLAR